MKYILKDNRIKPFGIKIGSASLLTFDNFVNEAVVAAAARQAMHLYRLGLRPFIVTSGAVAAGRHELGWVAGEKTTPDDKALAASVGQLVIMDYYKKHFIHAGFKTVGQELLINKDLIRQKGAEYSCVVGLLNRAFREPLHIPVINENDSTTRVELKGLLEPNPNKIQDNDPLTCHVGASVGAVGLSFVSTHCIHTKDPKDPLARPISFINFASKVVNPKGQGIETNGKSNVGTGGAASKLDVVKQFLRSGPCGERFAWILSVQDFLADGVSHNVEGGSYGTELVCYRSGAQRKAYGSAPCSCAK